MNPDSILHILKNGEISLEGQFLWGSNYTLMVDVTCQGECLKAVYKPTRGVRPLWDFDAPTLARREVAAYHVSRLLGWDLVPQTVYREDGPMGSGSLQRFVEHDPEYHFFNFSETDIERLEMAAAFDIVINNADRKGGHFLVDPQGHIWLIDHGICFHEENKLRTVLWNFSGQPLHDEIKVGLKKFEDSLATDGEGNAVLQLYLDLNEIYAMQRRARALRRRGVFPQPPRHSRPYPWPLV
jgi:uncharacterized repeat protein (TIGR03843 family)